MESVRVVSVKTMTRGKLNGGGEALVFVGEDSFNNGRRSGVDGGDAGDPRRGGMEVLVTVVFRPPCGKGLEFQGKRGRRVSVFRKEAKGV